MLHVGLMAHHLWICLSGQKKIIHTAVLLKSKRGVISGTFSLDTIKIPVNRKNPVLDFGQVVFYILNHTDMGLRM